MNKNCVPALFKLFFYYAKSNPMFIMPDLNPSKLNYTVFIRFLLIQKVNAILCELNIIFLACHISIIVTLSYTDQKVNSFTQTCMFLCPVFMTHNTESLQNLIKFKYINNQA